MTVVTSLSLHYTRSYASVFPNCSFLIPVQNGAVTQKDTLNDDEFEPYLNAQPRQVGLASALNKRWNP